jgi:hypothetical protein
MYVTSVSFQTFGEGGHTKAFTAPESDTILEVYKPLDKLTFLVARDDFEVGHFGGAALRPSAREYKFYEYMPVRTIHTVQCTI